MSKKDMLTFHNHPLRKEILLRFEADETPKSIHDWLKKEHPQVVLSWATLGKHKKIYQFNKKHKDKQAREAIKSKKKHSYRKMPIEKVLWETIMQCRKKKKDDSLSVKDWQYLDQQMQSALEKLMRISESTGDSADIATVLSQIFEKLESGEEVTSETIKAGTQKELSEEEKLKIAEGVKDEDSTTEDTKAV